MQKWEYFILNMSYSWNERLQRHTDIWVNGESLGKANPQHNLLGDPKYKPSGLSLEGSEELRQWLTSQLDQIGQEGWEMVNFSVNYDDRWELYGKKTFVFKRPKQE